MTARENGRTDPKGKVVVEAAGDRARHSDEYREARDELAATHSALSMVYITKSG